MKATEMSIVGWRSDGQFLFSHGIAEIISQETSTVGIIFLSRYDGNFCLRGNCAKSVKTGKPGSTCTNYHYIHSSNLLSGVDSNFGVRLET